VYSHPLDVNIVNLASSSHSITCFEFSDAKSGLLSFTKGFRADCPFSCSLHGSRRFTVLPDSTVILTATNAEFMWITFFRTVIVVIR
jgi:hypothetical protein